MSLFEDARYIYRDTFFVFFQSENRPTGEGVQKVLTSLGDKYAASDLRMEEDGRFESISVQSPQDYSAMDITFIEGDEVREQIRELMVDFKLMTLTGEDRKKIALLEKCNCRLDVFHFAEVSDDEEDEDEILDPGGLFLVMEKLAKLSHGVCFDPQAQSLF